MKNAVTAHLQRHRPPSNLAMEYCHCLHHFFGRDQTICYFLSGESWLPGGALGQVGRVDGGRDDADVPKLQDDECGQQPETIRGEGRCAFLGGSLSRWEQQGEKLSASDCTHGPGIAIHDGQRGQAVSVTICLRLSVLGMNDNLQTSVKLRSHGHSSMTVAPLPRTLETPAKPPTP